MGLTHTAGSYWVLQKMALYQSPRTVCCVFDCRSRVTPKNLEFFKFPSKKAGGNLLMRWVGAVKIPKKLTRDMTVCHRHFKDSDFIREGVYPCCFTMYICIYIGRIQWPIQGVSKVDLLPFDKFLPHCIACCCRWPTKAETWCRTISTSTKSLEEQISSEVDNCLSSTFNKYPGCTASRITGDCLFQGLWKDGETHGSARDWKAAHVLWSKTWPEIEEVAIRKKRSA